MMISFYLTGIAREWYDMLPSSAKTSLQNLKTAFLNRFKPLIDQGVKLTDLKQMDHESV